MKKATLINIAWVLGVTVVVGVLVAYIYKEKARNANIDAIMSGPIRANKDSRVFHVPTCPQYDSIGPDNIRTHATVEEARAAGYRPSMNCLAAIDIRTINESGETADIEESRDRPY